jgi:hypothetical protein
MSIFGISGAIGTGKSFLQLLLALEYANEREKQLVFNFDINFQELEALCKIPKWIDTFPWNIIYPLFRGNIKPSGTSPRYPWILHLIRNGGISCIPNPKNLQSLLIPESVVCLDEAGILLNSRDFANTPKALLADLCQSRKDGVDLFWASQFDEQVDKQFRLLTQYWIHSDGVSVYDKKMKRPKLVYQRYYWFRAADYFEWLHNRRDRSNHFRTRFAYASKYVGRFLTSADKQLFRVYDSFSRLDTVDNTARISTVHNCPLNFSYYYSKLGEFYDGSLNPFSKEWIPFKYEPSLSLSPPSPPVPTGGELPPKSALIARAMSLSRSLRISPPYFKNMSSSEISLWISQVSPVLSS